MGNPHTKKYALYIDFDGTSMCSAIQGDTLNELVANAARGAVRTNGTHDIGVDDMWLTNPDRFVIMAVSHKEVTD